ncbi:MAG TPA: protein-disulfide reductase DsbD domain-containing protein, partial [Myxococcaceae bacterium]|nr:protein-disulfide reductase DsbD domain-containing protein [Myxococcaceae bacterium]
MGPLPLSLCALMVWAAPASAEPDPGATAAGAVQGGVPRVEATLLSGLRRVSSGERFPVGVLLKMAPGWHVYWRNPGEAGLATEVSWSAPGLEFGPLQWPLPAVLRSPDGSITTYGYPGEVVLLAEARAGPLAGRTVHLTALVDVLACEVQCIPATLSLGRELEVSVEPAADVPASALLEAARARVPVEAHAADVEMLLPGRPTLVAGQPFDADLLATDDEGRPVGLATGDVFIPDRMAGLSALAVTPVPAAPGRLRVFGKLVPEAAGPVVLQGVLRLAGTSDRAVQIDVPLGTVGTPGRAPVGGTAAGIGFGWALVFAFLGGVLLNLMPCVFPVLALKAYGFVRTVHAGGGRAAGHALAYTAGISVTMLVLAAAVLVLRAAGRTVGWGFQF